MRSDDFWLDREDVMANKLRGFLVPGSLKFKGNTPTVACKSNITFLISAVLLIGEKMQFMAHPVRVYSSLLRSSRLSHSCGPMTMI